MATRGDTVRLTESTGKQANGKPCIIESPRTTMARPPQGPAVNLGEASGMQASSQPCSTQWAAYRHGPVA